LKKGVKPVWRLVSNNSTMSLLVVGGDEKVSLIYETVKYGHKS
jgi:hypothetical protein